LPYTLAFGLCHAFPANWAIEGVPSAETTLRSAEELLAIADEQGFPDLLAWGTMMRGWCLGAMGQPAEAIPLILQGLESSRATGAGLLIPFYLMTLAEVYGMAAQADEGLKRLAEAATIVEATQERWAKAEMYRLRGTLLLSMHERAAAEDSFRRALTVAQQQSAKFWELRAATSLTRLWCDQGKRKEARNLLAPIYGWFTEGLDTPVLQDAKALLDELA
jgi:predicted ATPase